MSDAVAGDPVVGAPNQIVCVVAVHDDYRLAGSWSGMTQANAFLAHLGSRAFSPATVRAYAYDVVNSARFLIECGLSLEGVVPTDIFDWVDWQSVRRPGREKVVPISRRRGSAPASVNRRAAAVRALFEYSVMAGAREDNPVPTPHRGRGLRPKARGALGHLGPGRVRQGGRLVRQQRRLPESLDLADVQAFLADLGTYRDRAIVLLMVFGGLRAAEVRSLRLVDVDFHSLTSRFARGAALKGPLHRPPAALDLGSCPTPRAHDGDTPKEAFVSDSKTDEPPEWRSRAARIRLTDRPTTTQPRHSAADQQEPPSPRCRRSW